MNYPIHSKGTDAGILHKRDLANHTIYSIFTNGGHFRGGKIYTLDKLCTILSGSCEITMLINNQDIKEILKSGTLKLIPAHTPHIFFFPEDTEMIEWFAKETKSKKYKRYYELKTTKKT